VAATYRVAADLPGLRTFGEAIDQLGGRGIAVDLDSNYTAKQIDRSALFTFAEPTLVSD
jgi:hypothetical protein